MATRSSILDANAYRPDADGPGGPDGTRGGDLLRRRAAALGPAYRLFYREPLELVRGSGAYLYDADGRAYLDAYNNVASVGHAHPRVAAAVARQAATLSTHTRYVDAGLVAYAERLLGLLPPAVDQVMLTCTGSEANDLALRVAAAATGGTGVIVTEEAYHGNTALVTGASPSLGRGAPRGEHVWTVPAPDPLRRPGVDPAAELLAAVHRALDAMAVAGVQPSAFLVDSILSSDGVHSHPVGYLAPAVEAVRAAGGLLVADEVQPGFARTGSAFWGFERHGLDPEIVTMGKPMGNGLPIAGMAARAAVLEPFASTVPYFNTFGGNHVSVAAAAAVLDVIEEEGLQENAARVGAALRAGVREVAARHPVVADVRGDGLFVGVELVAAEGSTEPGSARAADVVNSMRDRGVLTSVCGPWGSTLKVRPPLVATEHDAARFVEVLDEVLALSPVDRGTRRLDHQH
ncbi:4-aminobutyrate aminotransferase-like enzyme [Nocardioides zeae]|uniref:4-aminobutyrate aminotransferase-like enzyme n=1 Tax=Nocardioides zeae TaxID=1457234 RepID=A0ACC6IIB1_9ACTN|nr:aspartate aminotransferase family protein [Nocardioides zeae]MDR6174454.1 4-aminobutyrate aminotransferase-like enzyme [Nocardioides zeae]MDR6210526.1 4-aminobutyrate aminotransferase-like enzyme [Nocardioides zeae]